MAIVPSPVVATSSPSGRGEGEGGVCAFHMNSQFHNLKFQKKRFLKLVTEHFARDDRKKIIAAFEFANLKHARQRRDVGTAYIIHPVRVAITLLDDIGTWDADMVAGALLHDVVEDCGVRIKTIRKQFGKRAASFVLAMTRPRIRGEGEVEKEKHKIEKLATLSRASLEIRMLKGADILDNLRCAADVPWLSWTPIARKKFPRWYREFRVAAKLTKGVHPVLYREIEIALRLFEVKRIVRGVVRLGM